MKTSRLEHVPQEDLDRIRDLAEIEDGLNDWEMGFVDDVFHQVMDGRPMSEAQRAKADQILEEQI